jgi:hypothetical protein
MGQIIEINDTLKLKKSCSFPDELKEGGVYEFCISGRRLYHLHPTRVFLVEEREGKWNFIGQAMIVELTIRAETNETSGKYIFSKRYPREYAHLMNKYDAPQGKGLNCTC